MAAGKWQLLIEQGATLDLSLVYEDSNRNPIDLTGYSGKLQIKSDYTDNNPITYATLSSSLQPDGTGIIFGGVSGTIEIYMSAASSSALTFSEALYDLEITTGSFVTRLLQGPVFISKQVTD